MFISSSYLLEDIKPKGLKSLPRFFTCADATVPLQLISYEDAKAIYKRELDTGVPDYFVNAYIHFYIDDQKFDGKRSSIWLYPDKALEVIKHFAGIITPDFSTNADFPDPIKRYNTYRMRAFGCWMNKLGMLEEVNKLECFI